MAHVRHQRVLKLDGTLPRIIVDVDGIELPPIDIEIEFEIVYNMYRMRRFTPNTVCAG
jgi:hypothetical protein